MGSLGAEEMVAIFIVALLLFGPKELPKLGRTIGKAMTEFRRAQSELKTTFNREMENLERETGVKELAATTFSSNSYNYDQSTYDTTYYDSPYNNSHTTNEANGASATQGAGTTALQIEGAAGSIASGHLDAHGEESYDNAWAPYNPAEAAPAAHGSAEPAETEQKPLHG
jgi:sec-independent protein translocase protein TatA